MAKYRWCTLGYPDGQKAKIIIEDSEHHHDLLRLQMLYGLTIRLGRYLKESEAAHLHRVQEQSLASLKGATPSRPLSPAFGRGSGGPI